MRTQLQLFIATGFLVSGSAAAAQEPPKPCSAPEYRQLDFWVGEWDLKYERPDGTIGSATNSITNDLYGACVVAERFVMPDGYEGASYSIYDREKKLWRQMWVDNQGGTFTLVGGPAEGQPYRFELRTVEPTGRVKLMRRMIWQDVTEDSLTWRWQSQQADGSWKDEWVLRYSRRETATNRARAPRKFAA